MIRVLTSVPVTYVRQSAPHKYFRFCTFLGSTRVEVTIGFFEDLEKPIGNQSRRDRAKQPVRVCVIVAEQHRQWWENSLGNLSKDNIIEQQDNRGTAHGILLPMMHILVRDPDAMVTILPAGHYVRDESVLRDSVHAAARFAAQSKRAVLIMGIEPDAPDTELGYIVPTECFRRSPAKIHQFAEKPTLEHACDLVDRGALWNMFIVVATGRAVIALFEKNFAATILQMLTVVRRAYNATLAIESSIRLYRRLPSIDFSRDILAGQESRLRVLRVPNCGWTDLGTPQRVEKTLQLLPIESLTQARASMDATCVNLATQHLRWQSTNDKHGMRTCPEIR